MPVTLGNLLWQNLLLKLEEQLSLSVSVVFHRYSTHPSRAGRREHIAHVLHQDIACNRQAVSGRLQKGLPSPPGQDFNLAEHRFPQTACKAGFVPVRTLIVSEQIAFGQSGVKLLIA